VHAYPCQDNPNKGDDSIRNSPLFGIFIEQKFDTVWLQIKLRIVVEKHGKQDDD
jgi:hypothetical protein